MELEGKAQNVADAGHSLHRLARVRAEAQSCQWPELMFPHSLPNCPAWQKKVTDYVPLVNQ